MDIGKLPKSPKTAATSAQVEDEHYQRRDVRSTLWTDSGQSHAACTVAFVWSEPIRRFAWARHCAPAR